MNTIYILSPPDSEVGVITNSSSMLFVVSDQSVARNVILIATAVADTRIEQWLGEPKIVRSLGELSQFAMRYNHVLQKLFPDVATVKHDYHTNEPILRAYRAAYSVEGRYAKEHVQLARSCMALQECLISRREVIVRKINTQRLAGRLPFAYYAAGQDSYLNSQEYELLHSLPLVGARLS